MKRKTIAIEWLERQRRAKELAKKLKRILKEYASKGD